MLRSSAKPVSARPARTAAKRSAKSSRDLALRKPTSGIAGCCARAKSGQATAEPTIPVTKSRRRIAYPKAQDHADFQKGLQQGFTTGGIGSDRHFAWQQPLGSNVRFGSKADIAQCETNVRFTPKSGH